MNFEPDLNLKQLFIAPGGILWEWCTIQFRKHVHIIFKLNWPKPLLPTFNFVMEFSLLAGERGRGGGCCLAIYRKLDIPA